MDCVGSVCSAIICKYSVISGDAAPTKFSGASGDRWGSGRLFEARSNSCNYAAYDKSIAFNYTGEYLSGISTAALSQPYNPVDFFFAKRGKLCRTNSAYSIFVNLYLPHFIFSNCHHQFI